jgi:nucleoid-associated protein YgaU
MNPEEVVRKQATDIENIRRDVSFMVKSIALTGTREVKELAKYLGIDLKKYSETTKTELPKATEAAVGFIKNIITADDLKQKGKVETPKNAVTQDEVKKIVEDSNKKDKEKTESVDKNVKVTNEYVFKGGDTLVDGWMREVGKNASIYNDFHTVDSQSYTSPSTAKR